MELDNASHKMSTWAAAVAVVVVDAVAVAVDAGWLGCVAANNGNVET